MRSTGHVALTRVSGSIYFDLTAPDLEQALEGIASGEDVGAILNSFNPQRPEYKALKAELALARRSLDTEAAVRKPAPYTDRTPHRHHHCQHGTMALASA